MSDSVRVSEKKSEAAKEDRTSQTLKSNYSQQVNSSIDRILLLQRTIGNQAVGRLIKSEALQAKLKIGHTGDIYEQEADRVAEEVMQMQSPSKDLESNEETAEDRCLTRSTAAAIVDVVASDVASRAVIEDPVTISLFRKLHIAGGIRNLAMVLSGMDPQDPSLQLVTCIGISENTANAIYRAGTKYAAVVGRPPKIPEVTHAISCTRVIKRPIFGDFEHHATRVFMTDGTDYVFDWHPTLDPKNPIIYQTGDWRLDQNGVEFQSFSGFF